jgi:hypothetical protein
VRERVKNIVLVAAFPGKIYRHIIIESTTNDSASDLCAFVV